MKELSNKRAREDSEWTEGFSSKYKRIYWFNNVTGKSVWEDPTQTSQNSEVSNDLSSPVSLAVGDNSTFSISSQHLKFMELLQKEHQEAEKEVPDHDNNTDKVPRCPRLIDSVDLTSLLAALRKETAEVVAAEEPQEKSLPPFKIVFSLANDNTALITRAIQEDEILKTRLLVYSGTDTKDGSPRAQILPSFWEVWGRPDRTLSTQILSAADPHEMKWQMQKEESATLTQNQTLTQGKVKGKAKGKGKFQYKLATTFMPAYAKQIYSYFQAKRVLDPCAGWGDRLLGAAATRTTHTAGSDAVYSGVERYVAFDPNRGLRLGYAKLLQLNEMHLESCDSDTLTCREGFQVHSLPFEVGASKLQENSFDLVFTSPPFFDYEMYSPRNPKYSSWIEDFYVPLMQNACRCVLPGKFVCIHIGDTTAGEIVPFLTERVKTICPLQLQFRIGLKGVMSSQVRDVWVFQKAYPSIPAAMRLPRSKELIAHVKEMTNPPIVVRNIADPQSGIQYTLFDDGVLVGGSKQRFLGRLLVSDSFPPAAEEFIYAGPDSGFAQVALAYSALLVGRKATVFLNTARSCRAAPPPLTHLAMRLGAVVHVSPTDEGRTLKETNAAAAEYAAEDPLTRVLMPFGLKFEKDHPYFEMFREAIIVALPIEYKPTSHGGHGKFPTRLWVVAGSGFIFSILNSVWPSTELCIVQVGKQVYKDQYEGMKGAELFVAPEKFADPTLKLPPYASVPWYDAKLWQFVQKHGRSGDAIWNVAAVAENIKDAAAAARKHLKSY